MTTCNIYTFCLGLSLLFLSDLNALPCYEYERQIQQEQGVYFDVKQPVPTTVPDTLTDLSEHRLGK